MKKETIVVSRNWNAPDIRVFVSLKEVGAEMNLYNFIDSMLEEIGSPTMMLTKKQLSDKMYEATAKLITEMKRATIHV